MSLERLASIAMEVCFRSSVGSITLLAAHVGRAGWA